MAISQVFVSSKRTGVVFSSLLGLGVGVLFWLFHSLNCVYFESPAYYRSVWDSVFHPMFADILVRLVITLGCVGFTILYRCAIIIEDDLKADIAKRESTENELIKIQERLLNAEAMTRIGNWERDLLTNEIVWSEGIFRILGIPPNANVAFADFLALVHSDDLEIVKKEIAETIREKKPYFVEYRLKRKNNDGDNIVVQARAKLLCDDFGKPIKFIGTIQDITDSKKATEDLHRAHREAKEALQVRDEFISIASHELRTPLTTLKLQLSLRQRQLEHNLFGEFSVEKIKKMLASDSYQLDRLNRLITDMLDVSRINASCFVIKRWQFDICVLAHDVVDRFQHLQPLPSIIVNTPGPILGEWDRDRIEQVFENLLTNAIKYGNNTPIHISVAKVEANVEIRVHDFGMGILKEDQERIFQRFERIVSSKDISGFGLGLYIVKKIIQLHNGSIRVESEHAKGTMFVVTLPT